MPIDTIFPSLAFKEMKIIFLDFICLRKLDCTHFNVVQQAKLTRLHQNQIFIHKINFQPFDNLFNGYFDCYRSLKTSSILEREKKKHKTENRNNFISAIQLFNSFFPPFFSMISFVNVNNVRSCTFKRAREVVKNITRCQLQFYTSQEKRATSKQKQQVPIKEIAGSSNEPLG